MNAKLAKEVGAIPIKDIKKHCHLNDIIYYFDRDWSPLTLIETDEQLDNIACNSQKGIYFIVVPEANIEICLQQIELKNRIKEIEKEQARLEEINKKLIFDVNAVMLKDKTTLHVQFIFLNGPKQEFDIKNVILEPNEEIINFGCRYNNQDTLYIAIIKIKGPVIKESKWYGIEMMNKYKLIHPNFRNTNRRPISGTGYKPGEDFSKSCLFVVK